MKKSISGFTIVELLIVIVVIAILAAISVVAYTGIQNRARDSQRMTGMKSIERALELYRVDNGSYPTCSNSVYVPGITAVSACNMSSIASSLVPTYLPSLPTDPINSGNDVFRYAVGYQKTGATSYVSNQSNNYITGMRLEAQSGGVFTGWISTPYYNYLGGSSN